MEKASAVVGRIIGPFVPDQRPDIIVRRPIVGSSTFPDDAILRPNHHSPLAQPSFVVMNWHSSLYLSLSMSVD